jgi:hypothetical protein
MPRAPELSVLAMLSDVVGPRLKAGRAASPARGYARRFAIPGWWPASLIHVFGNA